MALFKNTKKVRDEVASVLQNASTALSWSDVELELSKDPETQYKKITGGFMLEWLKILCATNSIARSSRLSGDIVKALDYEKRFERMVDEGVIVTK